MECGNWLPLLFLATSAGQVPPLESDDKSSHSKLQPVQPRISRNDAFDRSIDGSGVVSLPRRRLARQHFGT